MAYDCLAPLSSATQVQHFQPCSGVRVIPSTRCEQVAKLMLGRRGVYTLSRDEQLSFTRQPPVLDDPVPSLSATQVQHLQSMLEPVCDHEPRCEVDCKAAACDAWRLHLVSRWSAPVYSERTGSISSTMESYTTPRMHGR